MEGPYSQAGHQYSVMTEEEARNKAQALALCMGIVFYVCAAGKAILCPCKCLG
jgi:hypothetical protein